MMEYKNKVPALQMEKKKEVNCFHSYALLESGK